MCDSVGVTDCVRGPAERVLEAVGVPIVTLKDLLSDDVESTVAVGDHDLDLELDFISDCVARLKEIVSVPE